MENVKMKTLTDFQPTIAKSSANERRMEETSAATLRARTGHAQCSAMVEQSTESGCSINLETISRPTSPTKEGQKAKWKIKQIMGT